MRIAGLATKLRFATPGDEKDELECELRMLAQITGDERLERQIELFIADPQAGAEAEPRGCAPILGGRTTAIDSLTAVIAHQYLIQADREVIEANERELAETGRKVPTLGVGQEGMSEEVNDNSANELDVVEEARNEPVAKSAEEE